MRTRELELVAAVLLFPPRFAVMAVAEVLAYLVCSIATIGHDPAVPLVPWRRQLMRNVVVPCCHVVLATIGIWSVRIDGMPDPAAEAVFLTNVPVLLLPPRTQAAAGVPGGRCWLIQYFIPSQG
jgi:hypothetical protein